MSNSKQRPKTDWWKIVLVIPLVPVIFFIAILALVIHWIYAILLHIVIWLCWCTRGRDILFVYSESPVWHDYIEQHFLPYLDQRAVILNWSQRQRWRFSLSRLAFSHFGGYREYNPLAVVFRPFRYTRTYQFWKPFREYKHGNSKALLQMENEFLGLIGIQKPDPQ